MEGQVWSQPSEIIQVSNQFPIISSDRLAIRFRTNLCPFFEQIRPRHGHRLDEYSAKDRMTRMASREDASGTLNTMPAAWQAIRRPAAILDEVLLSPQSKTERLLSADALARLAEKVRVPQEFVANRQQRKIIRFDVDSTTDNEVDGSLRNSTCWPYDYEPCEHHTTGCRPSATR